MIVIVCFLVGCIAVMMLVSFTLVSGRMYGDTCRTDNECAVELNLVCKKNELWTCHCRRGYMWNVTNNICYRIKIYPYDNGNKGLGAVHDIFAVFGFVVIAIGASIFMGFKLLETCKKFWKKRLSRQMEEVPRQQQDTCVAAYTVFSSLNGMETRSSPGLSPGSSFPLHPTPCLGLFLPSGPLAAAAAAAAAAASTAVSTTSPPLYEETTSPPLYEETTSPPPYVETTSPPPYQETMSLPPYEEALKHNVITSSFPSATAVILPTAPPIQGPPNNMSGGTFVCNSQGGLN